ncbi:hypothetical protein [Streptomyces sp. NPDC048445]|uniref:hypothetical protein n=1 Tax=Streptomyces sp. NPDC048445 TaxID=3365553 RepID=UPI00370F7B67
MSTPALAACAGDPDRQDSGQKTSASATSEPTSTPRGRILLACFSRPGENYCYGDRTYLKTGNTEVVTRKLHELIGCDLYRIEPADPYVCSRGSHLGLFGTLSLTLSRPSSSHGRHST